MLKFYLKLILLRLIINYYLRQTDQKTELTVEFKMSGTDLLNFSDLMSDQQQLGVVDTGSKINKNESITFEDPFETVEKQVRLFNAPENT